MKIYDGSGDDVPSTRPEVTEEGRGREPVGVADLAISLDGPALVTSGLGSCVAIGITDCVSTAGLAHVMLPSSEGRTVDNPAKFVDTAVPLLIDALRSEEVDPAALSAKIAGGGEMLTFSSQERSIGERNVEAVRRGLAEHGIPITGEDIGGREGRTVSLTPAGTMTVKTASDGERRL